MLCIVIIYIQVCFVLFGVIVVFNCSYLEVSVYLQLVVDVELLGLLESGGVDLVVVSIVGVLLVGVIVLFVYCWQCCVVVFKEYLLVVFECVLILVELVVQLLVSYDFLFKFEFLLCCVFELVGLQLQIVMIVSDVDLIKIYVCVGFGVGVLVEMVLLVIDSVDLWIFVVDQLFVFCIIWIVLCKDSVLCEFVLVFIIGFVFQLECKVVVWYVFIGEVVEWLMVLTWCEWVVKVMVWLVVVKV